MTISRWMFITSSKFKTNVSFEIVSNYLKQNVHNISQWESVENSTFLLSLKWMVVSLSCDYETLKINFDWEMGTILFPIYFYYIDLLFVKCVACDIIEINHWSDIKCLSSICATYKNSCIMRIKCWQFYCWVINAGIGVIT